MKITIDTKEDSYEDIQKVLHILTNIIERKGDLNSNNNYPNNIQTNANIDTSNMMNMFDEPTTSSNQPSNDYSNNYPTQKNIPDTPPNFNSFLNLMNNNNNNNNSGINNSNLEKKKEDKPKVILW